ncbi:Uncharacterized protein HZ326_6144 [Fusarium oxysporum f. sp. albedinis]|nr:Uncharacterized protein HZ326_6144 [Fusarium oxysporum f. sp. albedinis]
MLNRLAQDRYWWLVLLSPKYQTGRGKAPCKKTLGARSLSFYLSAQHPSVMLHGPSRRQWPTVPCSRLAFLLPVRVELEPAHFP